jgi:hypothetical protein
MNLVSTSLDEDAKKWFKGLLNNRLQLYESFTKLFKVRWKMKKDNGMLLMKLNEFKKKENEPVKEFDAIFDNLYNQISKDLCIPKVSVLLLYLNSFEG